MSAAPTASAGNKTSVLQEHGSSAGPNPAAVPTDDILYEVRNGQIKEKSVGVSECEIASILAQLLGAFVRSRRLGRVLAETLFRIDPAKDLQYRPDVAFVSHARWPFNRRVPKVAVWDMVPDLAIEVVSPTNAAAEVQEKVHDYFAAGVIKVWVVFPGQQQVYVYASPTQIQVVQLAEELDGGELLSGFRLPLATLFEDEPD
jgi:Uma2 family endonuclease